MHDHFFAYSWQSWYKNTKKSLLRTRSWMLIVPHCSKPWYKSWEFAPPSTPPNLVTKQLPREKKSLFSFFFFLLPLDALRGLVRHIWMNFCECSCFPATVYHLLILYSRNETLHSLLSIIEQNDSFSVLLNRWTFFHQHVIVPLKMDPVYFETFLFLWSSLLFNSLWRHFRMESISNGSHRTPLIM